MVSVIVIVAIVGGVGWMVWGRRGRWRPATVSGTPEGLAPERLAFEAFTHGNTCLAEGKFAEATAAFHRSLRARSEAAPCRRAPGRSGPAATRRKRVAARQRSILSRASEPHGSHGLMGLGLAWRSVRAPVVPGGQRRPQGAAGAPFHRGDRRWTTWWVEDHGGSATMAKRSRQTFQKHQKEQARQQKQKSKADRRLQAKQRRADAASESSESPGETGRHTTQSTACTNAGRSCQRADIAAAPNGVMGQGLQQMPCVMHGTPSLEHDQGEEHR